MMSGLQGHNRINAVMELAVALQSISTVQQALWSDRLDEAMLHVRDTLAELLEQV